MISAGFACLSRDFLGVMPQMLVGPFVVVQMMLNLNAKQPDETVEKVLASPDLNSIIDYILSGKCKNIITMAGAGISTCKYLHVSIYM